MNKYKDEYEGHITSKEEEIMRAKELNQRVQLDFEDAIRREEELSKKVELLEPKVNDLTQKVIYLMNKKFKIQLEY